MLDLSILQNRWLIAALLGGLALVGVTALAYIAIWRPRETETVLSRPAGHWFRSFMPWALAVVVIATIVWGVVYTLVMAAYPPNW